MRGWQKGKKAMKGNKFGYRVQGFFAIWLSLVSFSCSYTAKEKVDLSFKTSLSVGVIFTPELKKYKELVYRPLTNYPVFAVGEALQESLLQALFSFYGSVEELAGEMSAGKYDLIIRFGLDRSKSGSRMSVAPLSSAVTSREEREKGHSRQVRCVLHLRVEVFNGKTLELLKKKEIEASKTYTIYYPPADDSVSASGLEYEAARVRATLEKAIDEAVKKTIEALR